MKYVDIVLIATGFTSVTVQQYILVFNEELYIPELDHSLTNTTQLRQFQTQVKDNTCHATEAINNSISGGDFTA